jgi:cytochrome P450
MKAEAWRAQRSPSTHPLRRGRSRRGMSAIDTARVVVFVLAPMVAQGVLLRRRLVARIAAAGDFDGRAIRVDRLRRRYGDGPLRLSLPGRTLIVPLDSADAANVLAATPEPFAAASREKRAALNHFQPHALLVSTGEPREQRRRLNVRVLQTDRPVHQHGRHYSALISAELRRTAGATQLDWNQFNESWQRIVRRIVLGDQAADDTDVTAMLMRLRAHGNWAYLRPRAEHLRRRFQSRIEEYVSGAAPFSLAAMAAEAGSVPDIEAAGQLPHWLFAYDAAGITVFRTLAVASSRPDIAAALAEGDDQTRNAYARACLQETLRLWPTTLVILRDLTADSDISGVPAPAGATVALVSAWLHRDPRRPDANRYQPDNWLPGPQPGRTGTVPFSDGPARCPGESLVLQTAGAALLELMRSPRRLVSPALNARDSMPAMLNHYGIRLAPPGVE